MKLTRRWFSPFTLSLLAGAAAVSGCAAPAPAPDAVTKPGLRLAAERKGHAVVEDDQQQAIARAQQEGKLLLYNFTAFNCATCRAMESVVLRDPGIAATMASHFVESRLHTDTPNTLTAEQFAANRNAQAAIAGTVANPFFVVVDPVTGKRIAEYAPSGGPSAWAEGFSEYLATTLRVAGR